MPASKSPLLNPTTREESFTRRSVDDRNQPIEIEVKMSERIEPIDDITRDDSDDGEVFEEARESFDARASVITDPRAVIEVECIEVNGHAIVDANGSPRKSHQHMNYHHRRQGSSRSGGGAVDFSDLDVDIDDDVDIAMCFPALDSAKERTGAMMKRTWAYACKVTHFNSLPEWLQDNDFLHFGHREPNASFGHCFRSMFSIHTETGNIWTHLLGCVAFIGIAIWFLSRPNAEIQWEDKLAFSAFFAGAILCMGMSSAFHTVSCHSHQVTKLFSKLDYCGISLLIVGSFMPWLYYCFYCRLAPMLTYMIIMCVMGAGAIGVSVWDKFAQPAFRPVRAGTFVAMGLSAIVPFIHFWITDGTQSLVRDGCIHWMALMGVLYITGACLYAARVPERWFPGKCDIWFQSHQIFHMFVVVAALVHYHGILEMANNRLSGGSCQEELERKWPDVYKHEL